MLDARRMEKLLKMKAVWGKNKTLKVKSRGKFLPFFFFSKLGVMMEDWLQNIKKQKFTPNVASINNH